MKNWEFWEKEIKSIVTLEGDGIAIDKNSGKPIGCEKCECKDCILKNTSFIGGCSDSALMDWLYSDHIEKPKISKRTKMFFESIGTGWIGRDKDLDIGEGSLCFFDVKPIKEADYWDTANGWFSLSSWFPWLTLDFIKWEDENPWSVEDILKLEVEDE